MQGTLKKVNAMLKKYPFLKWFLIAFTTLVVAIVSFGFWFMSLLPSGEHKEELSRTLPEDLPYLSRSVPATVPATVPASRGKILAVVTSCGTMGSSQKATGYELTELARAYYVFQANGFEVDIASPGGGAPPVVIDWDDMGAFDYAFLNDSAAQRKTAHTIPIAEVVAGDYQAVYFAGGKGAMWDFPQNITIQSIVREYYESGKVVGAVCHGPAALVNVTLAKGNPLLAGKAVSGFTNEEELFLIPDATSIFPFLLEDALIAKGARFSGGHLYLENLVVDGSLVTGQNPWSTWAVAEAMVRQLGYSPKERLLTAEENTVNILLMYETAGYAKAKSRLETLLTDEGKVIDRQLLAIHGIVAAMQWNMIKAVDLVRLLGYAKEASNL